MPCQRVRGELWRRGGQGGGGLEGCACPDAACLPAWLRSLGRREEGLRHERGASLNQAIQPACPKNVRGHVRHRGANGNYTADGTTDAVARARSK
jgi:hypothetical protein